MKVLSVVGARPQFVKLAPMHVALRARGHEHLIAHTGQHYDPNMSESIFSDLGIPEPHINLAIGSGSHAEQTAGMLVGLERAILEFAPDWVLVYGDTNSTIAAALAAVKLGVPIAHLEAGLRSGNRAMPEEHNRIATDHLSDLLLAPSATAMRHLEAEGLSGRAVEVGDVMVDVCLNTLERVRATPPEMPAGWDDGDNAIVATIHRAENTNSPERLELVLSRLSSLGRPVTVLAHPRLVAKCAEFGIPLDRAGLRSLAPLTYSQMVFAIANAEAVVTDSGGLQKEAFIVRTPCVTARTETEWPETLAGNWNVIRPDLDVDLDNFLGTQDPAVGFACFGDGHAAERAVRALESARVD